MRATWALLGVVGAFLAGCASSSSIGSGGGSSGSAGPTGVVQASSTSSVALPPLDPTFGPSGTLGSSSDPAYLRTLNTIEAQLPLVPLLPGAIRVAQAPVPVLAQPDSWAACAGFIDRAAFWTVDASPAATIAYSRANPPDHLGTTDLGTGTETIQGVRVQLLSFGRISYAGAIEIHVDATASGTGTAVRVDVQSVWNYPDDCESNG